MSQSLFDLHQWGEINYDVALSNARGPNYFRSQVDRVNGHVRFVLKDKYPAMSRHFESPVLE